MDNLNKNREPQGLPTQPQQRPTKTGLPRVSSDLCIKYAIIVINRDFNMLGYVEFMSEDGNPDYFSYQEFIEDAALWDNFTDCITDCDNPTADITGNDFNIVPVVVENCGDLEKRTPISFRILAILEGQIELF